MDEFADGGKGGDSESLDATDRERERTMRKECERVTNEV